MPFIPNKIGNPDFYGQIQKTLQPNGQSITKDASFFFQLLDWL